MSTELQPRACHRNVVGRTLALRLDEQRHVNKVVSVPCSKRLQTLQTFRVGCDNHFHITVVGGRCNESVVGLSKSLRREIESLRLVKFHTVTVAVSQRVGHRIEIQTSSDSQSRCEFGASNECERIGVAISTAAEVAVERCHNGILALWIIGMTVPLTNTRTTSVSHDDGTDTLEVVENTIAFCSGTNLLTTWIDDQLGADINVLLSCLTGN